MVTILGLFRFVSNGTGFWVAVIGRCLRLFSARHCEVRSNLLYICRLLVLKRLLCTSQQRREEKCKILYNYYTYYTKLYTFAH